MKINYKLQKGDIFVDTKRNFLNFANVILNYYIKINSGGQ